MAFGKKGWRRIVVEDQVYYWQAEDGSWVEGFSALWRLFYVRPEAEPHRLLTVTGGGCGDSAPGFSGVVSPRMVEGCIEYAIKSEWLGERPQLRLVVFTNPFRPVAFNPSWLTSTVRTLARGVYSDRAFDRMPILADALQDAGCDNEDILNHLRGPGPHTKGCWALDLLLGKV